MKIVYLLPIDTFLNFVIMTTTLHLVPIAITDVIFLDINDTFHNTHVH